VQKTSNLLAVNSSAFYHKETPLAIANRAAITPVSFLPLNRHGIELSLYRLDAIDPLVSGNKFFKLYNHIQTYISQGHNIPIASFGGAFSNHLHALAAIGEQLHIKTIGVIRGEAPKILGPTLKSLMHMGMKLHYVSRLHYKRRHKQEWRHNLERDLGKVFWVPEGGGGCRGVEGCVAIGQSIAQRPGNWQSVFLGCGTGSTLAGVISGMGCWTDHKDSFVPPITGISALKGAQKALESEVSNLLMSCECLETFANSGAHNFQYPSWQINGDYHCGGFGKNPLYLRQFVDEFEAQTSVLLDPVYTAKMLYAITSLASTGCWPPGSKILAIHTGGLQGRNHFKSALEA